MLLFVAEFKGDCNFESTSIASAYSTVSESNEWVCIAIAISNIPGFTTSQHSKQYHSELLM